MFGVQAKRNPYMVVIAILGNFSRTLAKSMVCGFWGPGAMHAKKAPVKEKNFVHIFPIS